MSKLEYDKLRELAAQFPASTHDELLLLARGAVVLLEENERLRKALEFYATSWPFGRTAREALERKV